MILLLKGVGGHASGVFGRRSRPGDDVPSSRHYKLASPGGRGAQTRHL